MTTTDELRKYELMLIVSGDLPEAEFEKELNELRKLLQESTKGISYEETLGKRDLAYRLKKQGRGYYLVFNFNAAPQDILELRSSIKLNQHILRHMLITLPDDYEPGRYKEEMLREERVFEERKKKSVAGRAEPKKMIPEHHREPAPKPAVVTKEQEEQLKTVEKKLEEILDNPDIDIR